MQILKLKLYSHKLELEKAFFTETLGFELLESSAKHFTVKTGWTEFSFEKSKKAYTYHYCFLIPANKLMSALAWMQKRVTVLDIEEGRKTERFQSWNADSFYFLDASGNIAEFIVRHDLEHKSVDDFDISQVLCLNEIGMPCKNIRQFDEQLRAELGTEFWKGTYDRFGTHGSQEGLLLLPNYLNKKYWFPTNTRIEPAPFEARISTDGALYDVNFHDGLVYTMPVLGS